MPDPVFTWAFLGAAWASILLWDAYRAGRRRGSRERREAMWRRGPR